MTTASISAAVPAATPTDAASPSPTRVAKTDAGTGATASISISAAAASPSADAFELGGFTIWGIDGYTVTAADFSFNPSAKTLTVNTDARFAMQNADQTKDSSGNLTNPVDTCLVVPAGRNAHIRLEGVSIKGAQPVDIKVSGELTLALGDGTKNQLVSTADDKATLHCPAGAKLTVDDSVLNRTADGRHITPENGKVPFDCTLENGTRISREGDLSQMESVDPGALYVRNSSNASAAAIGADYSGVFSVSSPNFCQGEAGGSTTFDGGAITVVCGEDIDGTTVENCGAAIGGGCCGNGTGATDWITINGGRVTATGGYHGAGIGAGYGSASGNVRINGGFVEARGGTHSNGFGGACRPQDSSAFQIVLTGGTLLPKGNTSLTGTSWIPADVGAPGLQVVVTGGSLGNDRGAAAFKFEGTARNNRGEEVTMIEIDLSSDVGTSDFRITDWQLLVNGEPYPYGAPAELDKGHLYLWLPKTVKENSEVTVSLTYADTDHPDENGDPTPVTPLPLFRPGDNQLPAGAANDGKLRRYADFPLDDDYLALLTKDYDGLPLPALTLPIRTPDERNLTDAGAVTYRYQMLDASGQPVGAEIESKDPSGTSRMPADAGSMRFVAISTQYSADTEGHFSESYWGHRAQGRCEIRKVPSAVAAVRATWADGSNVADPQDQAKVLAVEVDVTSGEGTAATCKAPEGRVQLYVDGEPVGDPVTIDFASGGNARVATDAEGREHTVVAWSFPAGSLMAPGAEHTVSARYLPAKNYFESADPAQADVPESIVKVKPDPAIAPKPALAKRAENLTHPQGPTQPGDRIRYTVTASNGAAGSLWTDVVVSDPLPACLDLDESSVRLTSPDAGLTDAALAKAASVGAADVGRFSLATPGADGRAVLSVPVGDVMGGQTAVLSFECTVRKGLDLSDAEVADLSNVAGATGTRPDPDDPDSPLPDPDDPSRPLPVDPDPTSPVTPPGPGRVVPADPDPAVSKAVENAASPGSGAKTTRIGDVLRYTVTVENRGGADSCLVGAVASDPLPEGLELVPGSIRLAVSGNAPAVVADSAYDRESRTIAVTCGDLWGGKSAVLTFDALVTDAALGTDIANVAFVHGSVPSENPGSLPGGSEPGQPAEPPKGEPAAESEPTAPPEVVPNDPQEGDVSIAKTAENLDRADGTTHVGDTVRYRIVLRNAATATGWMDAVIRDDVPRGLEPISGTVKLQLPDGGAVNVPDSAYDPESRTLAVTVGRLYGGQEAVLSFDALVTQEAVGADIGNVAAGYGTPPSDWDPDAPMPQPGTPFDPPDGWDAYASDHPKVVSDPAFPPGVRGDGGLSDAGGGGAVSDAGDGDAARRKAPTAIAGKLTQTGDMRTQAVEGIALAAALVAASALLAGRRRRKA